MAFLAPHELVGMNYDGETGKRAKVTKSTKMCNTRNWFETADKGLNSKQNHEKVISIWFKL